MSMGVDHGRIMKTLHGDTLDILYKRADILHGAVRAMDGRVAYVIMGQKEIAEKISHTKTSTVSAQSCAIATILNLVLPCMRKKKTGGDVLSVQTGNGSMLMNC